MFLTYYQNNNFWNSASRCTTWFLPLFLSVCDSCPVSYPLDLQLSFHIVIPVPSRFPFPSSVLHFFKQYFLTHSLHMPQPLLLDFTKHITFSSLNIQDVFSCATIEISETIRKLQMGDLTYFFLCNKMHFLNQPPFSNMVANLKISWGNSYFLRWIWILNVILRLFYSIFIHVYKISLKRFPKFHLKYIGIRTSCLILLF